MIRSITTTAVLLAALCAGCGSGGSSSGQSAGATRFLSLGTAPPGGAFFVVGGAVAEVLNESGAEGWQVTAEATKGTLENIRRLARGEIDLAVANAAITYFALRGEPAGEWEQPFEMRSLVTLAPNVAMFVTQRSSGIENLSQLKGHRVVVGVAGAGFEFFVRPLLAAHGVSYDEFTPVYNTQSGAVDLLSDGAAAAAFLGGAVPTASITQAASSGDVMLIPFDPEAREKLIADYPFFRPATIPAGTYRGQDDEYAGLDVGSMHLIVSADQDEALAYELTKTIWENRAAVVAKHPAGRAINQSNAVRDTGTPFHPGAIRYYREIGIWPEDTAGSEGAEAEATEEAAPGASGS
jgi:TRAP transporter TAXI family solute receptor